MTTSGSSGQTTSPTLLTRLRDPADRASWYHFERTYRELIIRYCRRRGVQIADAEDIVQRVMLKLMMGLRTFEYDPLRGRFRDYLYCCVRSVVSDTFRGRVNGNGSVSIHSAQDIAGPEPDDDALVFECEWVDHHYRMAIAHLRGVVSPDSMAVLDASIAGQSPRVIAQSLGMSEDAVYKSLQRTRARLKDRIAQQIADESPGAGHSA